MDHSDTHHSSGFFSPSSTASEHFTWNDYPVDSNESHFNKRPVEVELQSLLIDHGPSEDSVGLIAARSPHTRQSFYSRLRNGWIRSRRKRKDCSKCTHVNRSKRLRRALRFAVLVLAVATGVYFALVIFTLIPWMPVDPFDAAFDPFRRGPGPISVDSPYYPTHYLQSVLPVPCHSHNDYWRRTPLYAALGSGCVSIEADVWLFHDREDELYVGHSVASLSRNATLRNLYVNPLVSILERMNSENEIAGSTPGLRGVFYQDPEQPLTLLIDFKTNGLDLWPHVQAQLAPLRERGWLTHWNGTDRVTKLVTVVATGNAPFEELSANTTYRDVFFDAPLDDLDDPSDPPSALPRVSEYSVFDFKYNPSNSHMASAPFLRALGLTKLSYSVPPVFQQPLTPSQTAFLRKQIGQARERGLLPRYWGTPRWPRGLRDRVWEVLVEEGVGLLNVDDLRAARKGHWGRPRDVK